jgi:hypothetical protein
VSGLVGVGAFQLKACDPYVVASGFLLVWMGAPWVEISEGLPLGSTKTLWLSWCAFVCK